ncbi:peptidylprolyl isomerase [Ottowia pentelensis]|uniref:peptidylprolyl isomerase n=1 Tax=Ottowia pentelensis TaxID=511108 RepID=A0ABV6PR23_9BURK
MYKPFFALRRWAVLGLTLAALTLGSLHVAAQPSSTSAAGAAPQPDVVAWGPSARITSADLQDAVRELVPADQQKNFWLQPGAALRFARSLYAQRVLADHALSAGLAPAAQGADTPRFVRERDLARLYLKQQTPPPASEAVLREYARIEYDRFPERYAEQKEEQVKVRHILLPVAADGSDDAAVKAKAEALLAQLRGGADFAALAREYSSDKGSASRGGELDWFARGRMAPAFEAAAFALKKPGDLSAPVKTQFGWHIIELQAHRPAGAISFEQAREQLERGVQAQLERRAQEAVWRKAEEGVNLNDAAVNALVEAHGGTVTR